MDGLLNNLVKQLSLLPTQCIYAFLNESEKTIYIGYTSNVLIAVNRVLNEFKNQLPADLDKLELKILEEVKEDYNLRVRFDYWSRVYSKFGWSLYRTFKPMRYKLRIDIMRDYRPGKKASYLFVVNLVSRRNRKLTVGVFDSRTECDEFVNINYGSGIDKIVYCENELTKEFNK